MPLNEPPSGLDEFLISSGKETVLFVGIGNVLRKDDGAGVYISKKISEKGNIRTLTVELSIENYIGKINSLKPGRLVLIDCTDLKKKPGTYRILGLEEITDLTFNTHNISLKRLGDFFNMPVWLLGIQPAEIDFGEFLTPPVRAAADNIIQIINSTSRII
jgi:hydrogenase 3 maturation protease